MDDILASSRIDVSRTIHVATLSRKTIIDAGADHLGFDGYFLFEAIESAKSGRGIEILGKAASLEAAFRLIDLWSVRQSVAA